MTLWTLLRKETQVLLRSRLLLIVLILYPLVLVGILGYAFSEPQKVPIAVVNEDIDPLSGRPSSATIVNPVEGAGPGHVVSSQQVIDNLTALPAIRVTQTDYESGRKMLLQGEVQAIVRFPINFARDIADYQTNGEVEVTIDKSDPTRALIMELYVRGIVDQFKEEVITEKVRLVLHFLDQSLEDRFDLCPDDPLCPGFPGVVDNLELVKAHADLTPEQQTALNESLDFLDGVVLPTLERSSGIVNSIARPVLVTVQGETSGSDTVRDLIVPAALGLSIFWTGAIATSSLIVYERESAAYTRLRITPATAFDIYGSKILLTLAIIFGQALLILGAITARWQISIDNPPLTLVVILLSTLASIGLGLLLSGLTRDVTGTVLISVLITFPMLFLSGLFYPVDFMPEAAQVLAGLFPLTYAVAGLRGAMLRGFDFADAQSVLVTLALFAFVLSLLGIILSQRLERRR